MAHRERFQTKLEIIKLTSQMFLSLGYTNTSTSVIAKKLDISNGNFNYHFPTKEHLLTELTRYLCEYQQIVMEQEISEGRTSLLAYLMELTAMMAICDENEVAKDLYTSIYSHSMPLRLIRETDTANVKEIFGAYCPDWTDEDFALAENVVSGIEYASLRRENTEGIPLDKRIVKSLEIITRTYNIPAELRQIKIEKILNMDYRRIGRQFIAGFTDYVEKKNEQALAEAHRRR